MDWSYYNWYFGVPMPVSTKEDPEEFEPGVQDPKDIRVYVTPWVSNARVKRSCGSKVIIIKEPYSKKLDIEDALRMLEEKMQSEAFYMGANSVTNFSCELYLWEDPVQMTASGTCAVLEFIG